MRTLELTFATIALLATPATGCGSGQSSLAREATKSAPEYITGPVLELPVAEVDHIEIIAADRSTKACTGQLIPLKVIVHTLDGKAYETCHGPACAEVGTENIVTMDNFELSTSIDERIPEYALMPSGYFKVPADPLINFDAEYVITAEVPGEAGLKSKMALSPDYSCVTWADHTGKKGDESSPDGKDGADLTVRATYVKSKFHGKLLLVLIESAGESKRRSIHVTGADETEPFTIDCSGGAGHDLQAPPTVKNLAADPKKLKPAEGGDGGDVTLFIPAEHPEILSCFHVITSGGPAGTLTEHQGEGLVMEKSCKKTKECYKDRVPPDDKFYRPDEKESCLLISKCYIEYKGSAEQKIHHGQQGSPGSVDIELIPLDELVESLSIEDLPLF